MKKSILTTDDLLKVAAKSQLAGVEGAALNVYTGEGDDLIDMEQGAGTLMDEHNHDRVFVISLKNNDSNTHVAQLTHGLIYDLQDSTVLKDGLFRERGASLTDPQHFFGSGSPKSLRFFQANIQKNPTLYQGMRIQTNNPALFQQIMTLKKDDVFSGESGTKEIHLSRYLSENQFNDKLMTVNRKLILDNETVWSIPVPGNTELTITLFGASALNMAKAFTKKVEKAERTINLSGRSKMRSEKMVERSAHHLGPA